MPILDAIDDMLVAAWIHQAIAGNSNMVASHGGRWWQEVAIPSADQGLKWPYGYFRRLPGSLRSTKTLLPKEYIGQQTSQWEIWSVRRFDNRPDWSAFNGDIRQLRESLTGVGNTAVYNGMTLLGNIRGSTYITTIEQVDDREDEITILKKGIQIHVTHK